VSQASHTFACARQATESSTMMLLLGNPADVRIGFYDWMIRVHEDYLEPF
jgi:hypothetical protein